MAAIGWGGLCAPDVTPTMQCPSSCPPWVPRSCSRFPPGGAATSVWERRAGRKRLPWFSGAARGNHLFLPGQQVLRHKPPSTPLGGEWRRRVTHQEATYFETDGGETMPHFRQPPDIGVNTLQSRKVCQRQDVVWASRRSCVGSRRRCSFLYSESLVSPKSSPSPIPGIRGGCPPWWLPRPLPSWTKRRPGRCG